VGGGGGGGGRGVRAAPKARHTLGRGPCARQPRTAAGPAAIVQQVLSQRTLPEKASSTLPRSRRLNRADRSSTLTCDTSTASGAAPAPKPAPGPGCCSRDGPTLVGSVEALAPAPPRHVDAADDADPMVGSPARDRTSGFGAR
jgi:hypothetical protein